MRFWSTLAALLWLPVAPLPLTATSGEVLDTSQYGAPPVSRVLGPVTASSRPVALPANRSAPQQDAQAMEASLQLDRATRRLIQQGLRDEGFDPGVPDGLFGPRTRRAVRQWQASRGAVTTGYLDGPTAELLRAAGAGQPPNARMTSPRDAGRAEPRGADQPQSDLRRQTETGDFRRGRRHGDWVDGTEPAIPGSPEATSRLANAAIPRRPGVVGALAIGHDRRSFPGLATGWAVNQEDADLARGIALRDCRAKFGGREIRSECSVVTVFEAPGAVLA